MTLTPLSQPQPQPSGPALPLEITLNEPGATAVLLAVFGVLLACSVLLGRYADRLGVPTVLIFLILGMLAGSDGIGGLAFEDYGFAARAGTAALVLILLDGGLNTSVRSLREALWPASLLATVGVAITAGMVAGFGRLLGLSWDASLLLGAVVSSTDAAAVFALLRGGRLNLHPKVGRTIEVESCVNDPMAVILTTGLVAYLTAKADAGAAAGVSFSTWRLLAEVPLQLIVGAGGGLLFGYVGRWLLTHVLLGTGGLYPALTLAIAFTSFGLTTVSGGSGFLAVFVTAVVLGAGELPYRSGLTRVHDALAWLSQITMFLMLGLLVTPSRLGDVVLPGLGIGLFLAFVARPLAAALCLLPLGFDFKSTGYVGWVGLRGAVPIILATFPVLAGVSGANHVFDIVFFIVVVSSLIPGATVRPVTRRLGLDVPVRPAPAAVLEVNATRPLAGQFVSYFIEPSVAVCGAQLKEIEFPGESSVVLLVREGDLVAARGDTVLRPGDHAYVFFQPRDRPTIELLFGRAEEG